MTLVNQDTSIQFLRIKTGFSLMRKNKIDHFIQTNISLFVFSSLKDSQCDVFSLNYVLNIPYTSFPEVFIATFFFSSSLNANVKKDNKNKLDFTTRFDYQIRFAAQLSKLRIVYTICQYSIGSLKAVIKLFLNSVFIFACN